jgi:hypothetical protein
VHRAVWPHRATDLEVRATIPLTRATREGARVAEPRTATTSPSPRKETHRPKDCD